MKYLLIVISVLFSLSVNAQRSIRTGKLFVDESIQLNKVYSSDTLLFFMQNNAISTGLLFSITNPSISFDFSATDLGFFLNYTNTDTSTFDVRADGVLLQWGANDGNVGIGTETPTEKLHVNGTVLITDTLTIADGSENSGYVLTSDASGNATWEDINTKIFTLPTYADDAAAGVGGLVAGQLYKTAAGEVRIKL